MNTAPTKLFICYASEDRRLWAQFEMHLQIMVRRGIAIYHTPFTVSAGSDANKEVYDNLKHAEVVLFLLSPSFLASTDFDEIIQMALEYKKSKGTTLIPILARHLDYASSPFADLYSLPNNRKPIVAWRKRDEAWIEIIMELDKLLKQKKVHSNASYNASEKPEEDPIPSNKEKSLGFLHLSDLHVGMDQQSWLWPGFRKQFFDDLSDLHKKNGKIDIVFFSGDLVFSGEKAQFESLDKLLTELLGHLKALGSDPVLIPVPGNHDLKRPNLEDYPLEAIALQTWTDSVKGKSARRLIFSGSHASASNSLQKLISDTFANYKNWTENSPLMKKTLQFNGILPGDFSTTIERNGLSIGIVGLNSAFLQLSGGNYKNSLDLHIAQLQCVCNGDAQKWLSKHDASFLVTHHPPDWLWPEAQEMYNAEIFPPGQFNAHFFGHMHDGLAQSVRDSGSKTRHVVQGASLFGLEEYNDGNNIQQSRVHGYSAGRLVKDQQKLYLRIFPRIRYKQRVGSQIIPDPNFTLNSEGAYEIIL